MKKQFLDTLTDLGDNIDSLTDDVDTTMDDVCEILSSVNKGYDNITAAVQDTESTHTHITDVLKQLRNTYTEMKDLQAQLEDLKEQVEKEQTNDDEVEKPVLFPYNFSWVPVPNADSAHCLTQKEVGVYLETSGGDLELIISYPNGEGGRYIENYAYFRSDGECVRLIQYSSRDYLKSKDEILGGQRSPYMHSTLVKANKPPNNQ